MFWKRKYYSVLLICLLVISMLGTPSISLANTDRDNALAASLLPPLQDAIEVSSNSPSRRLIQGNLSDIIRSDSDILAHFGANDTFQALVQSQTELRILKKDTDPQGQQHYLLQQHYEGLPVYGQYIRAHVNTNQRIYAITNDVSPLLSQLMLDIRPSIDENQAVQVFQVEVESAIGHSITTGGQLGTRQLGRPTAELMIYPHNEAFYLAYRLDMEYSSPEYGRWIGFVDAHSGAVLKKFSRIMEAAPEGSMLGSGAGYHGTTRELNIFNDEATHTYYLKDMTKPMYQVENGLEKGTIQTFDLENPFFPLSSSRAVFTDPDAVDAHYYAGQVYDFYYNQFNRNSLDGNGISIISVVNGGANDNAYWNGYEVVYGDGVGTFSCLSCANDVVAHELTHAITEYTANLEYVGQSGALNESVSDIMAAVFDADDWMIGEDLGLIGGARALRDLRNPEDGFTPQPDHMSEYVVLPEDAAHDNGGIHTNSGIPNHAAYLIATGIDDLSGLVGQGRYLLGQIVYGALTSYLTPTSGFIEARDSFVLAAGDLNLTDAERAAIIDVIKNAWATVGLPYTSHENNIVSFSVAGMKGMANIDISAHSVTFEVEYGTDLSALIPSIAVSPGATIQSGIDVAQDFTDEVTITVTSFEGDKQPWTVQGLINDPATLKEIIHFQTDVQTGPAIIDPIQHVVTIYVEADDSVTSLQPYIELSEGATITPAGDSIINLSSPVVYTVTAQNGTSVQWTVRAIKDSMSPKLLGAVALDDSMVALVFDKPMSLASLGNFSNYTITSLIPNYTDPQVTKVEVNCSDYRIVYLTTTPHVSMNGYEISISNLSSSNGFTVRPDWRTSYYLTEDTAPPVLSTARVKEKELALTFNEYVQVAYSANPFTVNVNGSQVSIESIRSVGRRIILTLENTVAVGATATVSYQPTAYYRVTDLADNRLIMGQVNVINRSSALTPSAGDQSFYINGKPKQMIKHPTEPIVYSIYDKVNTVISANLVSGVTHTITLDRQPERLYYSADNLYVALVDQPHSSYWWEEDQTGSIAILNGSSLELIRQFNISMDPFDLAVASNGIIYVTSGSGQHTDLTSYTAEGVKIAYKRVRQQSYLQLSNNLNRLYTMNTDVSPRDINAFNFNNLGQFTDVNYHGYNSPYHGDYAMAIPFRISSDQQHLFTGAGTIFTSAQLQAEDMVYERSIAPFNDLAFASDSQKFYTLTGQILRQYNYATFALESELVLTSTAYAIYPGLAVNELLVAYYDNNGTTVMPYSLAGTVDTNTLTSLQGLSGVSATANFTNACSIAPVDSGGSTGGDGTTGGGSPPPPPPPVGGGGAFIPPLAGNIIPVVTEQPEIGPSTMASEDLNLTKQTDSEGEVTINVKPDPVKLLDMLQTKQEDKRIVLDIKELGQHTNIELPSSVFIEANKTAYYAVIAIQSDTTIYEVPVRLLSEDFLKQVWGKSISTEDLQVNITMENIDKEELDQIHNHMSADGFRPLSDSIDFTISITARGLTKEVSDFNDIYVTRSFIVPHVGSADMVTALIYDPDTEQTSFVPATVRVENSQTFIDVKAPHNSIYTIATSTKTFKDLTYHWAKEDIEFMASKKVVVGINSSEFKPELSVTRAEFSALLVRSLGLATPNLASSIFSDVNSSAWYAGSVNAAASVGLISGYANGLFKPQGIITRQEMAVMIGRAISYVGANSQQNYDLASLKDMKEIGGWAAVDVELMLASGIMDIEDNSFKPNLIVTRADATVALKRMLLMLNFVNQ